MICHWKLDKGIYSIGVENIGKNSLTARDEAREEGDIWHRGLTHANCRVIK